MVKKFLGIVLVLGMLLATVPLVATPVAAAPPTNHLVMMLVDPVTGVAQLVPDSGYNVAGSIIEVTAVNNVGDALSPGALVGWSLLDVVPGMTPSTFVPTGRNGAVNPVRVQGDWGETIISVTLTDELHTVLQIDKKWGKIDHTDISGTQSFPVNWYEGGGVVNLVTIPVKSYYGTGTVTDTVTGDFVNEFGVHSTHLMQGVKLNWFVLHGSPAIVPPANGSLEAPDWIADINNMKDPAIFGTFPNGTPMMTTVSDGTGSSMVTVNATGEESITVVVIPQYPSPIQLNVVPEVTDRKSVV